MSIGTLETVVQAGIRNYNKSLHTAAPGTIDAFDPVTQFARVSLAIKTLLVNGEEVAVPELVDVPVSFDRGGGFTVTRPVRRGDECLVVFCERSIDRWKQIGAGKIPAHTRDHDLSDGIAFVALSSQPNKIQGFDPVNYEIKSDDGKVSLKLLANGSFLVNSNGAVINVLPNKDILLQNDGGSLLIANNGDVTANVSDVNVNASSVTVDAATVTINGDLQVQGSVTDNYTSNNNTMSDMRDAYNAHGHVENGASNTTEPTNTPI